MTGNVRRFGGVALSIALVVGGALAIASACSGDGRPAGTSPAALRESHRPGSLVAADSLANTRIGGPFGTVLAFRFRARWTGPVRGVRFYVIVNVRGRRGYSGGTGGRLRVALTSDSGTPRHVPRGRPLAAAVIRPSRDELWPFVRFANPPHVVAGRLYHVVFTNVDADPRRNYASINTLLARGKGEPMPPVPDGLAVLLGGTADGGATPTRWRPRAVVRGERYTPIVDVVGPARDQHLGIGYMEVWAGSPRPVGAESQVRQLMVLARERAATITGAWLRVLRTDHATAPLELRLERTDGTVLASASVAARRISSRFPQWVHVRFPRPVPAQAGTPLALTASAARDRSYQTFPLRKGTGFGFDARTLFAGGYAQYSAGEGWTGWEQWGVRDRRDSDLQFALDVAR